MKLENWVDKIDLLCDEQNGFRKSRSTLKSIIETRKAKKTDIFVAFIDFSKVYDSIPHEKLCTKLKQMGLCGRLYNTLISLYKSVRSCVRVNGVSTNFLSDVKCGLKQGCLLSPLLFNLYIDDHIRDMKLLNIGIEIEDEKICVLLYVDDVILIADKEEDLQSLLNYLHDWSERNGLKINKDKSKIVHFRRPSVQRSVFNFPCGELRLDSYNNINIFD